MCSSDITGCEGQWLSVVYCNCGFFFFRLRMINSCFIIVIIIWNKKQLYYCIINLDFSILSQFTFTNSTVALCLRLLIEIGDDQCLIDLTLGPFFIIIAGIKEFKPKLNPVQKKMNH